jgi:hypothetical protein
MQIQQKKNMASSNQPALCDGLICQFTKKAKCFMNNLDFWIGQDQSSKKQNLKT